jgi:hypothetical protein
MTNRLSETIALCQVLSKEGKKPSVGLVRSRAGGKLSVPEAIKGIQSWQAQPDQVVEPISVLTVNEEAPVTLETRVAALEKQISELTLRLERLTQAD